MAKTKQQSTIEKQYSKLKPKEQDAYMDMIKVLQQQGFGFTEYTQPTPRRLVNIARSPEVLQEKILSGERAIAQGKRGFTEPIKRILNLGITPSAEVSIHKREASELKELKKVLSPEQIKAAKKDLGPVAGTSLQVARHAARDDIHAQKVILLTAIQNYQFQGGGFGNIRARDSVSKKVRNLSDEHIKELYKLYQQDLFLKEFEEYGSSGDGYRNIRRSSAEDIIDDVDSGIYDTDEEEELEYIE